MASKEYRRRVEGGFALTEATFAIFFIALVVGGGSTVAYLAYARSWLSTLAYEANICLATGAAKHICEIQLREAAEGVLPIGNLLRLELERTKSSARAEIRFGLERKELLRVQDHRRLPLTSGRRS